MAFSEDDENLPMRAEDWDAHWARQNRLRPQRGHDDSLVFYIAGTLMLGLFGGFYDYYRNKKK